MPEHQDVAERICEMAAVQGGVDVAVVCLQTRLDDDLGYDSLDRIEFAMQIEEAFDIELADEEAEKVRTVEEAVVLVNRIRADRASAR
jgi:acyl carrier protein